jgi:hypothetical protein
MPSDLGGLDLSRVHPTEFEGHLRGTVVPRSFWLLVERPARAERSMIFGVSR